MKNRILIALPSVLTPLLLDIEKSSARRRFLRHIKGFCEDYDLEATAIRQEFSEKNPDGSMKTVNNLIQFVPENRKKADAKFDALNNLEIPVDWAGEEKDKEVVIEILNGLVDEAKKATEFSDSDYQYLEQLEEFVKELE